MGLVLIFIERCQNKQQRFQRRTWSRRARKRERKMWVSVFWLCNKWKFNFIKWSVLLLRNFCVALCQLLLLHSCFVYFINYNVLGVFYVGFFPFPLKHVWFLQFIHIFCGCHDLPSALHEIQLRALWNVFFFAIWIIFYFLYDSFLVYFGLLFELLQNHQTLFFNLNFCAYFSN